jgi:hypothetical protein
MPDLDPSHGKLLGALTIAALKHLGDDTAVIGAHGQLQTCRVVRVGDDIALVDLPADDCGPRCINCYAIEVDRFDAIDGVKFKLDQAGLIYSLQWKHNGHPPDLHLAFVQEVPAQWVNAASLTLLSALRRWAPQAIDWTEMQDLVPVLDAFEAAMDSKTARRH